MTVGEMLTFWLDNVARHTVRETTAKGYADTIRVHIVPALGSVALQKLTPAQVQAFYSQKLTDGASPRTVQLCHLRLSQALKHAMPLNIGGSECLRGCRAAHSALQAV